MYRGRDKILQLPNGTDEQREHRLPTLQKAIRRSGKKFTVQIMFFDAMIGSKSYTICTMHVKDIFPTD